MSRHYQLKQERKGDRAFFSTRFHEPVFPVPCGQQDDPMGHRAPRELTLLLGQRLFLKGTPVPRMWFSLPSITATAAAKLPHW
jgi:hypothetical protein